MPARFRCELGLDERLPQPVVEQVAITGRLGSFGAGKTGADRSPAAPSVLRVVHPARCHSSGGHLRTPPCRALRASGSCLPAIDVIPPGGSPRRYPASGSLCEHERQSEQRINLSGYLEQLEVAGVGHQRPARIPFPRESYSLPRVLLQQPPSCTRSLPLRPVECAASGARRSISIVRSRTVVAFFRLASPVSPVAGPS